MAASASTDPVRRLLDAVSAKASGSLGRALPAGTTVVPSTDREGSTSVVAYPLGDRTVIWCAPALAPQLKSLNGPDALTADEYLAAAAELGGAFVGMGRCRVLNTEPKTPSHEGYDLIELDRDNEADRQLLAAFIAACPKDDLDEAELDIDDLDPAIVVAVAPDGSIASYASGRDWWMDADFDDVGVVTHPDHRGHRLGAVVVAEFAKQRMSAGRLMFYNCDVENLGSNRVAETVGFELVVTVAAARFE
jgi:hypothetical protein